MTTFLTRNFLILLIGVAALVSCNVKFRKCGPATIKKITVDGTENVATPVIYRNKTYTIKIEYKAGEKVHGYGGLKTQWYCIMNGLTLPWDIPMAPGCQTTTPTCPIVGGHDYLYAETFSVPGDAPKMKAVVKMVQQSGNNDHLCAILSFLIK